jgi:uncharacterized protein YybS (DUF2232 family)
VAKQFIHLFRDDLLTGSAPKSPSPAPLPLVETAFLSSAACLMWLINTYFLGGQALKPFLALPVILVYLRWGKRAGWMSVIVSSLLLAVLMGPIRSILFIIPYGLIGIQLGAFWRRGIGWGWSILVGAILDCSGFFFRIWLASAMLGEDLWSLLTARTTDLLNWALDFFGILTWILDSLGILAEPTVASVQIAACGILLLNSLLSLLITHLIALLLFERIGGPIPRPPQWLENMLEL